MSIFYPPTPPGAGIAGPGSSTVSAIALWSDNTGTAVANSGLSLVAGVLAGANSVTVGRSIDIDSGMVNPDGRVDLFLGLATVYVDLNDNLPALTLDSGGLGALKFIGSSIFSSNIFANGIYAGGDPGTASAILSGTSTVAGFLPPQMTTTQKNAIASPAEGLIVYDLTLHAICVNTNAGWKTVTVS